MMDSHGPEVLLNQQLVCSAGLLVVLAGIVVLMRHSMRHVARKRMTMAFAAAPDNPLLINATTAVPEAEHPHDA